MLLTEKEKKVKEMLELKGFNEFYPFYENGVEKSVDCFEELLFRVVLSYDTFQPIIDHNHHYSENEIRNINLIQEYQEDMEAYYHPFFSKRSDITEEDIKDYDHLKLKHIFNKAVKKNRGIFFITALKGYTSTTLYDNPEIEKGEGRSGHEGCGMYRKNRLYGKLAIVVPKTLELHNGKCADFSYPYSLNGKEYKTNSIYDIYSLAYEKPEEIELLHTRKYYSGQQKKIVKGLKRLGGRKVDENK